MESIIMRLNPQKMKKITVVMKNKLVNKLDDVCDDTEDINRSELIQLFCEYGLDNIDDILPEHDNDEDEDQEDDNDQEDDQDDYDTNEDDDDDDDDEDNDEEDYDDDDDQEDDEQEEDDQDDLD